MGTSLEMSWIQGVRFAAFAAHAFDYSWDSQADNPSGTGTSQSISCMEMRKW